MTDLEARISDLEARLEMLAAKEQIRDILHLYARGADRGDADLMKSCYWPDATDDHGFFGGNAHAFVDYVIPALRQIKSSIHQISNEIIHIEGSRAHVESQWKVLHRVPHKGRLLDYHHEGRYIDIFACRDGTWKILSRLMVIDSERLFEVEDMSAVMQDALILSGETGAPYDPYMVGKRAPDDTVYAGFDLPQYMQTNRSPVKDLWTPYKQLAPLLQRRWLRGIVAVLARLKSRS